MHVAHSIVATPGRLCYLVKETALSLRSVTHCVFDEADQLFEMGFAVQLRLILNRMTKDHQTMLFSATMPATLVDFSRACLTNPVVIRLDTDVKISKDLQVFLHYRIHSAKTPSKICQLIVYKRAFCCCCDAMSS